MNVNDLGVQSRVPFRYGISSGVMVGSAVITVPLTLDAASQFELRELVASSSADVKTQAINNYFNALISQINGQSWSQRSVPEQCFSTQSQTGWKMNPPVILPARFQLQVEFTDLGTGGTHLVELVGYMLK